MVTNEIPVFGGRPQLASLPERVAIVANPLSTRASSAISEIVRQCRDAGIEVPSSFTTTIGELGDGQARRAVAERAELVIAIGGDGTVRKVAEGVAGTGVRLGIIALGTGNVLASNLGLTRLSLADQARAALRGPHVEMDLGWARMRTTTRVATVQVPGEERSPQTGASGQVSSEQLVCEEPFATMCGIGRDALAVSRTGLISKKRAGWGAYALSGAVEALLPPIAMSVQIDDDPPTEVRCWSVLAGNTPGVLGGVLVYPGAFADDGELMALEVPLKRIDQWLPVMMKGLTGHDRPVPALRYSTARRLRVWPSRPLPVQLDGDVVNDVVELDVSVRRRCVKIQLPLSADA